MKIIYYHDGQHGWLKVPYASCKGLDIYDYSYRSKTAAYLECDCDAPKWLEAHPEVDRDSITSVYHDGSSPIRRYAPYGCVWPEIGQAVTLRFQHTPEWDGWQGRVVSVRGGLVVVGDGQQMVRVPMQHVDLDSGARVC